MAPRKNGAKKSLEPSIQRKSQRNNDKAKEEKLQVDRPLLLDDVTCKICMMIMVEPVTMPCGHGLCHQCFENCVQNTNLACPMCRKRISIWVRQAKRDKTLINLTLWEQIQAAFPDKVKARVEGEEQDLDDYVPVVPVHQFAEPGEILQEFEKERRQLLLEEEKRRKEEEEASAKLIAELERQQAEELARAAEAERILREDEALAQRLSTPSLQKSSQTPASASGRKRTRKSSEGASSAKRISKFFSSQSTPVTNQSNFFAVNGRDAQSKGGESATTSGVAGSHEAEASSRGVAKQLDFEVDASVLDRVEGKDVNENETADLSLAEELKVMERQWLERKRRQEEADREFARQLQEQLDRQPDAAPVNRTKGSHDQYLLRPSKGRQTSGRTKSSSSQQVTIEDAFQRRHTRQSDPLVP